MGIYGAMSTAVTGLRAQSYALENISGNIANSQTFGYKRTDTSFVDLIPDAPPNQQKSGSVNSFSRATNSIAGDVQASSISTNMAINGEGFFVVKQPTSTADGDPIFGGNNLYTRRGDFDIDKDGYLVNGSGYYLLGMPIDPATGNVSGSIPEVLKLGGDIMPAQETSVVEYRANLPAYPLTSEAEATEPGSELLPYNLFDTSTGAVTYANQEAFIARTVSGGAVTVYNEQGAPISLQVRWGKTSNEPETWSMFYQEDSTTTVPGATTWRRINQEFRFGDDGRLIPSTLTSISLDGGTNGMTLPATGTSVNNFATAESDPTVAPGDTFTLQIGTTSKSYVYDTTMTPTPGVSTFAAYAADTDVNTAFGAGVPVTVGGTTATITATTKAGLMSALNAAFGGEGVNFAYAADGNTIEMTGPATGAAMPAVSSTPPAAMGTATVVDTPIAPDFASLQDLVDAINTDFGGNVAAIGPGNKLILTAPNLTEGVTVGGDFGDAMDFGGTFPINPSTVASAVIPGITVNGQTMTGLTMSFGQGGLTQYADENGKPKITTFSQNGYASGEVTRVAISDSGRVVASYSNGRTRDLAEIPLYSFNSPNSLKKLDGGAFEETLESGQPIIGASGSIVGGANEGSNTDIADEFTKLIVTQQAYAANTRIVTTSDQMLQEALNMKR